MLYKALVTERKQAILHLLIHSASRDGDLHEEEIEILSKKYIDLGLQEFSLEIEMKTYYAYSPEIERETSYILHLTEVINTENTTGLFAHVFEMGVSDNQLTESEILYYETLRLCLRINDEDFMATKMAIFDLKLFKNEVLTY